MKKYIIFDFDGTLANTNEIITESWQATFEHYLGHRVDRREIEATFGEVLRYTIGRLLPDAPCEEVIDFYRAYQDAHQQGRVSVFPGIRELISELRSRGLVIGIATSRTAYSYRNYMRQFGLEDSIDHVVTMEDVTRHKPDPESVTAVLARMAGLEPGSEIPDDILAEAVMIGDTRFDICCAGRAGIDSVLVEYSHYVDEEAMAAMGYMPTYRISSPMELLGVIGDK